jgi:hypothetical protein
LLSLLAEAGMLLFHIRQTKWELNSFVNFPVPTVCEHTQRAIVAKE